jgi:hypothetical protein
MQPYMIKSNANTNLAKCVAALANVRLIELTHANRAIVLLKDFINRDLDLLAHLLDELRLLHDHVYHLSLLLGR